MFSKLLSFFVADPKLKIQKKMKKKLAVAMQQQRNGDLKSYAKTLLEVDALEEQYIQLCKEENPESD